MFYTHACPEQHNKAIHYQHLLSLKGINDMKHVSMYEWCLYPLMHKHVHISIPVYLVLQKPSLQPSTVLNVGSVV